MKKIQSPNTLQIATAVLTILVTVFLGALQPARGQSPDRPQLPADVLPALGVWFWTETEFESEGYRPMIDKFSRNSPFNYLATTIRAPYKEVTDGDVHDQIKAAAQYAQDQGVPLVMDLDVRLARRAFEAKYPDELQQMLLLEEVNLSAKNKTEIEVKSLGLSDHYTAKTTPYIPLQGALLRVYSYDRDASGIDPLTLQDITKECIVLSASKEAVRVRLPKDKKSSASWACAMVSFTHLSPDVFAPHLIDFQRQIIKGYSDAPLAGVFKDEWGFPPCFDGNPEKNQFWYSKHRAVSYAERTNGRDLLADCLLMHLGINGQESQRLMAINHFMEMSYQRNGELEDAYYETVKEVFGPKAIVLSHPTWWPYPDLREFKKNGLDWWIVTRDWAQTDETTPFAVRTALAKKWGSPLWYNMYYAKNIDSYIRSVWSFALAGGRINYHSIYPRHNVGVEEAYDILLNSNLMQAECRVRLLNYVSQSPLDCPVAVVFGHASAMNWAGSGFNDVGMKVADDLWRKGFPADLIPSSEIENKSLYIDKEGWICYGAQRYSAVVLYNPEFEKSSTAQFFDQALKGPTQLFRIGDWTRQFNGQTLEGEEALPISRVKPAKITTVSSEVIQALRAQNIHAQTPATGQLDSFATTSVSTLSTGFCRLIDGTIIQIAGSFNISGDPIQSSVKIGTHDVVFDAVGVASVRLDPKGQVDALAAGGLKHFKVGNFEIRLDERADIALWKDQQHKWTGVLQGWGGAIPKQLLAITKDWIRIDYPIPLDGRLLQQEKK